MPVNRGKYKPKNPQKYVGDSNNIIYRSSWERRVMLWLDHDKNVINWSSEEFHVKYYNPVKRRIARYFPDFLITVRENNGKTKTICIEVKPDKETKVPERKNKKKQRYLKECATYAVNRSKWEVCEQYCKDHGWEFKIVTEKQLGIK